jgi:hypothetical protein
MPQISRAHLNRIAETVSSQIALIQNLRLAVTEAQAESENHREQDALQAQLDRFTAAAANLDRALEQLAA